MFVTAVCVLFLLMLRWPKKNNFSCSYLYCEYCKYCFPCVVVNKIIVKKIKKEVLIPASCSGFRTMCLPFRERSFDVS